MINTFKQALDNLFKIEFVGDYTLDKIIQATKLLGNPQDDFKIIHVAGTNGKGSVSKMIFSILKEARKRVGVFTSPHLIDIKERFETQDGLISEDDFVEIINKIIDLKIDLSYFEKCLLIALLYFRKTKCEYVVLEVGFGGLLDTTNIVSPVITTITSIGFDHQDFLGHTLEEISYQKAGIIKNQVPIVINHKNKVIEDIAIKNKSPIIFTTKKIKTNLLGDYQEKNAALAYEICKYLNIKENIIINGLQKVKHLGRLQFLNDNLLIDGAHNINGLEVLKKYIDKNLPKKFENIYYCFGLKKGKNPNLIYDIFGIDRNYIGVNFKSDMLEYLSKYEDLKLLTVTEIKNESNKNKNNLYVVFGSLYMIGEFLK